MSIADERLQSLYAQVTAIIAEGLKTGADAVEVGVSEDTGLSVTARLGAVETIEFHRDRGFAVTVYLGQSKGSASTSDTSADAVRATVQAAKNLARFTGADPYSGLADPALFPKDLPDLDLFHPWALDADEAIERAVRCEDAARAVPAVTNSEGASVATYESRRVFGTSNGFLGGFRSTRHSVSCSVIAGTGAEMQRDYWYSVARKSDELNELADVGRIAGERAVARLRPRRIAGGRYPIVFAPEVAAGLFGHFMGAISGGALYRKASFLLDSIGQAVFPPFLRIDERPLLPGGFGSAAFDGDGIATRANVFVDAGVVSSYALGLYSARKLSMAPTGNGGGVHNLFVSHGDKTNEQLLRQMHRGLYVTELMGQGVNLVTGDYSRGAAGFFVDGGQIVHPVDQLTVAANLRDMFRSFVDVGCDLDYRRNIVTGSVLVDGMTVASE